MTTLDARLRAMESDGDKAALLPHVVDDACTDAEIAKLANRMRRPVYRASDPTFLNLLV